MTAAVLSDRWKLATQPHYDSEPNCAACEDAGCPECSDAGPVTEDDIMAELADMLAVIEAMDEAERAFDCIARQGLADVRAGIVAAERTL